MRLIDADNIKDTDISFYLGTRYESHLADFRDLLDEQPTIRAIPVNRLVSILYLLKEEQSEIDDSEWFEIILNKLINYIKDEMQVT